MRVRSVVVLAQVGRMAIGAHVVPVLIDTGPVASVTRRDLLTGIQKEPPLAAALARARVPGDSQRLQTSAGHRDEILLQRIYAERKFDFVVMQRAVRSVGAYHEARSISKEARRDAVVIEAGAIEVAQHRRRVRRLHRQLMVRAAPESILPARDRLRTRRRRRISHRVSAVLSTLESKASDGSRIRRATSTTATTDTSTNGASHASRPRFDFSCAAVGCGRATIFAPVCSCAFSFCSTVNLGTSVACRCIA